MALVSIPTSADIYIEVNGTKVAAAQSYRVKSSRQSRYVEAFGSSEPVGTAVSYTHLTLPTILLV